ncbi:MAG TPA: phosphotransferase [Planctomycetaceae bacterium]|jgi:Ser/Thr protein kinase RdoA (MazF antagonist)|nr:phosphotransferase [Planctomycetaceae bacterium]
MDPVAVDAVLQLYPDRFRSRGFCLPPDGPGFSGAVVLRVETDAGRHCLRGWPPEANAERIGGLHRLLNHARSRGIDFVAVPVRANDGRTLVSVAGRSWQLEPWLPGRADFSSRPSDARLTAAVTSLARLHVELASFEPVGAERQWFGSGVNAIAPAVTERFDRLRSWTSGKLADLKTRMEATPKADPCLAAATRIASGFTRCAPFIERELRDALRIRVPVQPCLRDVWHDHLLFDGDRVSGIIDPAAARTDTVAADISRLLGSLIAIDAEDRKRSLADFESMDQFTRYLLERRLVGTRLATVPRGWYSALTAYASVRRLSPEEMILIDVLDCSGTLLSGMTWLARRFFSDAPFEHPERVAARMEMIAKRIDHLAPSANR